MKKKKFDYVEQFPHIMGTALPIAIIILVVGLFAPKVVKAVGASTLFVRANVVIDSEVGAHTRIADTPSVGVRAGHHYAAKAFENLADIGVAKKEIAKPEASAKITKKKRVGVSVDSVIPLEKKKKHDREEREIYRHIECAKKRYPYFMKHYGKMTNDSCEKKGIEGDLGIAVFLNESGGDKNACSDSGAIGVCQVMPRTAICLLKERHQKIPQNLDSALKNPQFCVSLATDHLRNSLNFYESPVKAVNAYWAGDIGVYYQCLKHGKDVDLEYYRIFYGIYSWIKQQEGEEIPPSIKPAVPPDVPELQTAVAN